MQSRYDGRLPDELREVQITPNYLKYPAGSALIECGDTRVICAASVEEKVPPFLYGKGQGWLTAEYALLPSSTSSRTTREASRGKQSGRTLEIQRLIGRSLRAAIDLERIGERTIWIDCDVIQADGGTRTASITGGYVALALALEQLKRKELVRDNLNLTPIAAVSLGLVHNTILLDLNYAEDSTAEVDMNYVMAPGGKLIEIQGTAEGAPFNAENLLQMTELATKAINRLFEIQQDAIAACIAHRSPSPL